MGEVEHWDGPVAEAAEGMAFKGAEDVEEVVRK